MTQDSYKVIEDINELIILNTTINNTYSVKKLKDIKENFFKALSSELDAAHKEVLELIKKN